MLVLSFYNLDWNIHFWSHLFGLRNRVWGPFLQVKWSEVKSLSRVQLFATPWTVAYQAPPSTGFSRQKYRSGLPFPSPGQFPLKKKNAHALWGRKPVNVCFVGQDGTKCGGESWARRIFGNVGDSNWEKLLFCFCSVTKLWLTLCDPMDYCVPASSVVHFLPELAQIQVHWVGHAI